MEVLGKHNAGVVVGSILASSAFLDDRYLRATITVITTIPYCRIVDLGLGTLGTLPSV